MKLRMIKSTSTSDKVNFVQVMLEHGVTRTSKQASSNMHQMFKLYL